jgi:hypothetical protein
MALMAGLRPGHLAYGERGANAGDGPGTTKE